MACFVSQFALIIAHQFWPIQLLILYLSKRMLALLQRIFSIQIGIYSLQFEHEFVCIKKVTPRGACPRVHPGACRHTEAYLYIGWYTQVFPKFFIKFFVRDLPGVRGTRDNLFLIVHNH